MELTIRIGDGTMAFAARQPLGMVSYEEYDANPGISAAANLRQAATDSKLMKHKGGKALVLVDTIPLIIPKEEFSKETVDKCYRQISTVGNGYYIATSEADQLGVVVAFAVNNDLRTVVGDNFKQFMFMPLIQPTLSYLQRVAFNGKRRKMYAYTHDGRLDIIAIQQGRLRFYNRYDIKSCNDAIYFVLNVWKQIGCNQTEDEIQLICEGDQCQQLADGLRRYVANVSKMELSPDLKGLKVDGDENLPFDLMTLYSTLV